MNNVTWFYRIAPAMLRQASYGTIKIGTYQTFKRLLVDRPEGESHFSCDLSRPRSWRRQTLWQNAVCSPSHSVFPANSSLSDETLLTNVMCGVLSGVISSSIANPTDVLKVAIYFADSAIVLSAKYVESLSNMRPCAQMFKFPLLVWVGKSLFAICLGGPRPFLLT